MILHPKYGVNPTMPICIRCKKETGEIALLGNAYKEEAPKNMIVNPIPCEECLKGSLQGHIYVVEAIRKYDGSMQPTGATAEIRVKLWKAMYPKDKLPKDNIAFCEKGFLDGLQKQLDKEKERRKIK